MTERPGWKYDGKNVVRGSYKFEWNGGFAVSQKRKNIKALHESIERSTGEKSLEISTKSEVNLGSSLSAFVLKLDGVLIECIYQSSKVFENGGPYRDLLNMKPKDAKRDERLQNSGKLIAFNYNGFEWSLRPVTAFYDYIYVKSALQTFDKETLKNGLAEYEWFTDIEFNPKKSVNTQARSAAILKALLTDEKYEVLDTSESWIKYHKSIVKG